MIALSILLCPIGRTRALAQVVRMFDNAELQAFLLECWPIKRDKNKMQSPIIFNYESHVQFLNDRIQSGTKKLNRYSTALRDMHLAKKLGYRSARSIGMVLEGKRLPSSSMILHLAKHFSLDDQESRYLELLVQRERLSRRKKSVEVVTQELNRLNPKVSDQAVLNDAYFSFISDWYHFVIKQLISSAGFRPDFNWIKQKLKNKISNQEIKKALEHLKLLKLIEDGNGKISVLNPSVTTTHDLPSTAIRSHHRQMMNRAIEALEEESVDHREYFSLTFKFDRKDLPAIKDYIRKFKIRTEKQFENANGCDVFQMNLQFFPHTTELHKGSENK